MLAAEDPALVQHLEGLQVAPSLVTTSWLLTCFVSSAIPLGALLRLWDSLFEAKSAAVFFGIACALLTCGRSALLGTDDTAVAYRLLQQLGYDLTDSATDALLAATFATRLLEQPDCLHAMRTASTARLAAEGRFESADTIGAAVAIAEATAAELRALCDVASAAADRPPMPAAPACSAQHEQVRPYATTVFSAAPTQSVAATATATPGAPDFTIVPLAEDGTSAVEGIDDGWSLVERVEREPPPPPKSEGGGGCSLSYWIMQLEAPRIVESHFAAPPPRHAEAAAGAPQDEEDPVSRAGLAARLDSLARRA